jgi:hypothetical protein
VISLYELHASSATVNRSGSRDRDGVAVAGMHYQTALELYSENRISFDAVVSACKALALASRARRRRHLVTTVRRAAE